MAKLVHLRRLAADDIEAAVDHYLTDAGSEVAARFISALERSLAHVARHPRHGSLRFSYELDAPDVRCWPLPRFPYLIFYVELPDRIDVWRVLHTRRDVPAAVADINDR